MNLDHIVRSVAGRLSLREPQAESLRKLAAAPEAVPALRDHQARSPGELTAMVEALYAMFPKLSDFERDFPSLCFALATGVGKTRLMGALISALHAAYGYKHFFVRAPKRLGNSPVGAYAWQSRDASQGDRATTLRIRFRYCVPRIPLKIGDELLRFVALVSPP